MNFRKTVALIFAVFFFTSCAVPPPNTADSGQMIRVATFNVAMGLNKEGDLKTRLQSGDDPSLLKVAEILQRVRPDIILLNEFDYFPGSADLFRANYLQEPMAGQQALDYQDAFLAPANTGVQSGMDFNNNGNTGDPEDAWGFGNFPGQYGMLVLSGFPIDHSQVRTFQHFLWNDMPGALKPVNPDGTGYYPEETWEKLRLSSKSHWDIPITIGTEVVHFLVSHPTPTVFDGAEDRNGKRNHDENRIFSDYVSANDDNYLVDDNGRGGGIDAGSKFVIAGDLNADPVDGGWQVDSMSQLLTHPMINVSCIPQSKGAVEATETQAGINLQQIGNPNSDTSDFNDEYAGNLRIDFVLPSNNMKVIGCGVYWPASDEEGSDLPMVSDHRLVWADLKF